MILDRAPRAARWVMALVVVGAFPVLLHLGGYRWFFSDDWDFLADRDGGSLHDLLRPHNEHWSTLPILLYRGMWHLFGLHSYLPYRVPVLLAHLAVAVLLRILMARAGVAPWLATALASLFALFGTGSENIVWAFQIGFVGSMVLGLAQLVLVDHDGEPDRRDLGGFVCGLASLLCSGVGVTMVVVVGISVLLRRGWRIAALHVVPLAATYLAWYLAYGRSGSFNEFGAAATPWEIAQFVFLGVRGGIDALSTLPLVGYAIALVAAVGWVALLIDARADPQQRPRLAAPAALAAGAVAFMFSSGFLRAGLSVERSYQHDRYLHLVVAFMIPALALGIDAVCRRVEPAAFVVTAVLVLCIPGNLRVLEDHRSQRAYHDSNRSAILTVAYDPRSPRAPDSVRPETSQAQDVTLGWLLAARRDGRLPPGPEPTLASAAAVQLALTFDQRQTEREPTRCTVLDEPRRVSLRKGGSIVFRGGDLKVVTDNPGYAGVFARSTFYFRAGHGARVVAWRRPLTAELGVRYAHAPPEICVDSSS